MKQKKVIEFLQECLRHVQQNVPHEIGVISAYKTVLNDLQSYDYPTS